MAEKINCDEFAKHYNIHADGVAELKSDDPEVVKSFCEKTAPFIEETKDLREKLKKK